MCTELATLANLVIFKGLSYEIKYENIKYQKYSEIQEMCKRKRLLKT